MNTRTAKARKGTYLHANGNKYIGMYRNGKRNGFGKAYYLSDEK